MSNYTLVSASGQTIPDPSSAVYGPLAHTVTLHPDRRVYIFTQYTLTVNGTGPNGVIGSNGILLAGGGNGTAGTNFVQTFGKEILAGPAPAAQASIHKIKVTKAKKVTKATVKKVAAKAHHPLSAKAVDAALGKIHVKSIVRKK